MGDNTTTRRELEHRGELKSVSDKVAKKLRLDAFTTMTLYHLLLNEFAARRLCIVHNGDACPPGDDAA